MAPEERPTNPYDYTTGVSTFATSTGSPSPGARPWAEGFAAGEAFGRAEGEQAAHPPYDTIGVRIIEGLQRNFDEGFAAGRAEGEQAERIVEAATAFVFKYFWDESYGWDDYDTELKLLRDLVGWTHEHASSPEPPAALRSVAKEGGV